MIAYLSAYCLLNISNIAWKVAGGMGQKLHAWEKNSKLCISTDLLQAYYRLVYR